MPNPFIRKNDMEYRTLGRTKLRVSTIGIGGGSFRPQDFSKEKVKEIISFALDKGINIIETGEDYDESKIGFALEDRRSKVYIATKSTETDKEKLNVSILNSLKKLNTDYIEIYQLHSVNSENELNLKLKAGVLLTLKKARSEGLIGNIGITGHHIPALIKAVKTNEFDTVQVPYNMTHTLAEELFDICKENDIGIMIMKPLGGGFLIDPKIYGETPKKGAEYMTAENVLRFILSNKKIHTTLIGMRETRQVQENIDIVNTSSPMSEQEKNVLNQKISNFLGDDYCRTCKYCMPCVVYGWPFEIDTYLRFYGFYDKYGYKKYREEYSQLPIKADACTGCRECEKKCPYKIPIVQRLKEAHEKLLISDYVNKEKEELFKINLLLDRCNLDNQGFISKIIKKLWYKNPRICSLDKNTYYKFSRFFRGNREFDLSIVCLSKVLEEEPGNDLYLRDIGECYMEKKEYSTAIKYLKKATKINPNREWTWFSLGKCCAATKQYNKAIYALQQNLKTKPQNQLANYHTHYYLAICYTATNQKDKALQHYKETTKYNQQIKNTELPEEKQLKKNPYGAKWNIKY